MQILEQLSQEQEALMLKTKDSWLNYIFSCKNSLNREKATIGINWLYNLAGLDTPIIAYLDSPIACQYAYNLLKNFLKDNTQVFAQVGDQVGDQVLAQVLAQVWAQVWDQVGDQVWDQVRAQVWDQVGAQVGDQVFAQVRSQVLAQVWDQVRDQVRDQVWAQVGDQVRAQVRDQVGAQVGAQVLAQVGAQVGAQVRDQVFAQVRSQVLAQVWAQVGDQVRAQELEFTSFSSYGNISDYGWVSFYDFFQAIGILNHEGYDNLKGFIQSGVYDMIQLNGVCLVSALPITINRDEQGRLHSTTEAAIAFQDGYKQFYIHGRAVPAWIVENPEKITSDLFIKEENAEIRAAMYEVLGQERTLTMLKAIEIDKTEITHANGETETLILYKTSEKFEELDNNPLAWVRFTCPSTGTNYLIDVEPSHENVIDAAKSTRPDIFEFAEDYIWNFRA